jgi:tetratricopeptide (TPR) repeat protein
MTAFNVRKPWRRIGASSVGTLLLAMYAVLGASLVDAEPYKPGREDFVLLRLDATARTPAISRDTESLADAAQNWIAQGRSTLDERHYGRAEAVLRSALPCLSKSDGQVQIRGCDPRGKMRELLLYADVLQHGHDFENAERVLAVILEANPSHAQALLLRATIRLARGEPRLALNDCSKLVGAVEVVVSSGCIAQSIGTLGRLDSAVRLLSEVLTTTGDRDGSAGWALGILADLLERQGNYHEAAASMERALIAEPANAALRIQAADLLLRHGATARAEKLLESLPPTGAVVLRRAMVALAQDRTDAAALRKQWLAILEAAQRLGLRTHDRDRAMGELQLLGRADEALSFAAENWRSSRDIEDARMLIGAAIAAGKPQAAAPALDWVRAHHVEDALIASMQEARE